ncbi:MAG: hypothetical protein AAFQ82_25865 [Myxococcota bacterium]
MSVVIFAPLIAALVFENAHPMVATLGILVQLVVIVWFLRWGDALRGCHCFAAAPALAAAPGLGARQ